MAEYYDKLDAILINALKYQPQIHMSLKVELMDYLETTIGEITQDIDRSNAGTIEINYQQGVRRTCAITLINNLTNYNPSLNRGIWLHTKFKVYIGLYVGLDIYWFTQGIYILTNPSVLNERSNKTITLNGVDKFGILGSETSFHELNGTYKIPAGTKIKNAIKSLLQMPIGNSGGKLYTCTFTGAEYWAGATSSPTGGYFLNAQYGLIPSAIKTVQIQWGGTGEFQNITPNYYAYNNGTSSFWFSTPHFVTNNDVIRVVSFGGFPLDPKPPIIDNRIIEYYDAIEFLGDGTNSYDSAPVMADGLNHYILRDSEGLLNNIAYSSAQPFYKVYLNREEVPYYDTTKSIYYAFNPSTNALWFAGSGVGTLGANDSISVIARMRGSIGDIKIPYDIIKSPNEFYADLLIELATIAACDIYYDANGYLNFVKGNEKQDMDVLPTVWEFGDDTNYYFDASLELNFSNVFNVIKVVGTNSNAKDVCEITVKNTELNSPMCVQNLGEKIKYVESSFCYNQPRTRDFANYLLKKYSRLQQTLSFATIILPFLDVNQVINVNDDYFELKSSRFIIQSLSLPLSASELMQVTASNMANIPYFEAQGV